MKLRVVDYREALSTLVQKTKRNAFRKVSFSFKQFADEGAFFLLSKCLYLKRINVDFRQEFLIPGCFCYRRWNSATDRITYTCCIKLSFQSFLWASLWALWLIVNPRDLTLLFTLWKILPCQTLATVWNTLNCKQNELQIKVIVYQGILFLFKERSILTTKRALMLLTKVLMTPRCKLLCWTFFKCLFCRFQLSLWGYKNGS